MESNLDVLTINLLDDIKVGVIMTIGELQQSKIIDENEFVCILKGDVDNPCRVYKGRFFWCTRTAF